jgi:hypothetical protein
MNQLIKLVNDVDNRVGSPTPLQPTCLVLHHWFADQLVKELPNSQHLEAPVRLKKLKFVLKTMTKLPVVVLHEFPGDGDWILGY